MAEIQAGHPNRLTLQDPPGRKFLFMKCMKGRGSTDLIVWWVAMARYAGQDRGPCL